MKKLDIKIIEKKPKKIAGKLCQLGQINIGDYSKQFIMSLDNWTIDEYKQQWNEAIDRIKTHDISCFITDITTLKTNPRINFWALYKINDTIFIQNQILGGEILKEREVGLPPYSSKTCYLYILPRRVFNEYGDKIDEWNISTKLFFASLAKKLINKIK